MVLTFRLIPVTLLTIWTLSSAFGQTTTTRQSATEAREHFQKGRYAQADSLYTRLFDELPEESDEYIAALSDYIELCIGSDKIDGLRPKIDQVLAARAKSPGKESPEYAEILNHLGQYLCCIFKFGEAEEVLTEALRIRKEQLGEESSLYVYSLMCLGVAYTYQQEFAKGEEYYLNATRIATHTGDRRNQAEADLCLAVLYAYTGRIPQALELFPDALKMFEELVSDHHPNYVTPFSNYASICLISGDLIRAEPLLLRAVELCGEVLGEEHRQYLATLNALTNLYIRQGKYEQSEELMLKSVDLSKKLYGESSPPLASSLSLLSTVYMNLGDYTRAEQTMRQSIEILSKTPEAFRRSKATSLNSLGVIHLKQRRFNEALATFREALEVQKEYNLLDNFVSLAIVNNMCSALLALEGQNLAPIESDLLAVIEMQKKNGNAASSYVEVLGNIGKLYLIDKQYDKAIAYIEEAIAGYEQGIGVMNAQFINQLGHHADALYEAGRSAESITAYTKCLNQIKELAARDFLFLSEQEREQYWHSYNFRIKYFLNVAAVTGASAAGFAYDCELFAKNLLLSSTLTKQNAILKSNDKELIALWQQIKMQRSDKSQEQSQEQERKLVSRLRESGIADEFSIGWQQVQQMLAPNEAAIEIVNAPGDDSLSQIRYYALILTRSSESPRWVPLCSEEELRQMLGQEEAASSQALYELVWAPIEPHLEQVTKIHIAPSGLFTSLSFAALRNQGTYLLDRYELHRLLSTRDIAAQQAETLRNPRKESLALFGGDDFGMPPAPLTEAQCSPLTRSVVNDLRQLRGQGFDYLPGSLLEVSQIEKITRRTKWQIALFTGVEATESRLKSYSGHSPKVVHISTHGFYFAPSHKDSLPATPQESNSFRNSEEPLMRSGLLFSGANSIWTNKTQNTDATDDGVLTAYEIANLDFSDTELVVLSACDTALGDIDYNEGVYGIQRAFRLAGVKAMIGSLWKVPDTETVRLMTEFYRHRTAGMTTHKAFAQAQAAMRATHPDDPHSWAGFVLVE